ncbi:HPr kinase/phosphorylase [Ferrovibrio sp.]|uniref:HPr kinase/phosphorylase n=1 Tax=Ferrovibrio sp. TaxID=1917215 RepID=UPI000CC83D4D|nr:HPr kinase/phosphatase C-terminal domain-containing protein [Ferrovibrio sp.]PJI42023.1 MAG: aldolase [Ferrovibrio sp.]
MLTIHASCVSIDDVAVLLRGPSGAGKSDLALRLLEAGAALVADDQTCLRHIDGELIASAPERLRGLLEIRGIGPVRVSAAAPAPVELIIDLVPLQDVPRLPEPRHENILDVTLPCLSLHAFEASAAIKTVWALARAVEGRLFEPDEIPAVTSATVTELFKRKA